MLVNTMECEVIIWLPLKGKISQRIILYNLYSPFYIPLASPYPFPLVKVNNGEMGDDDIMSGWYQTTISRNKQRHFVRWCFFVKENNSFKNRHYKWALRVLTVLCLNFQAFSNALLFFPILSLFIVITKKSVFKFHFYLHQ